jgi:ABC-2 type transport system permease protein
MIGKIVGTPSWNFTVLIWAIISVIVCRFFSINATPTAKISPELMQAARICEELHKCILRSCEMLLRPSSFVFSFILLRLLLYSSFYAAIGAAVDNQTDSQILPV